MSKKRKGLGSLGVDVLLSAVGKPEEAGSAVAAPESLVQVPVEKIRRGRFQPRRHIRSEALEELAASIRAQGVVQPVVLRAVGETYELVAGERRWRAAQLAGLTEIPAVVRELPDQAVAAVALIENIQREDLNPLEEAAALRRLIDEFGLTHQEVADAVGRSRAAVSNLLRLLELAPEAARLLEEGRIEMGHARALLALPRDAQGRAAAHVAERGLSVRQTEHYVRGLLEPAPAAGGDGGDPDPHVADLERRLAERLGARVQLRHGRGGRGRLVIHYNSLDELEGVLSHIR
jgi:ParB family chromosome partitioning protein